MCYLLLPSGNFHHHHKRSLVVIVTEMVMIMTGAQLLKLLLNWASRPRLNDDFTPVITSLFLTANYRNLSLSVTNMAWSGSLISIFIFYLDSRLDGDRHSILHGLQNTVAVNLEKYEKWLTKVCDLIQAVCNRVLADLLSMLWITHRISTVISRL